MSFQCCILFVLCTVSQVGLTQHKEADPPESIKEFHQLIGSWKRNSGEQVFREVWSEDGAQLNGRGLITTGDKTRQLEKLSLLQEDGDWYYVATVANQNGGRPVFFKLVSFRNEYWEFSNPEHDFPQKISYRFLPGKRLKIIVSGQQGTETKEIVFEMARE